INDNGPATPYPSNIFVTGAGTVTSKITVTLNNVSHTFAGDVEALLVGPGGQNLVVLSDAGTAGVSNVTVTFDDAAAGTLPVAGTWAAPNSTISARPTNHNELSPDTFPPPAPAPSAATTLATFNGANPNGTWSLYVRDDGAPDTGSIAGGWCITISTLASPTLTTQASPGGPVGTQVNDVATLAGGANPTGSITFNLYGPGNNTCTGSPAHTSNVVVSGNGNYTSSNFTPASVGTYRWVATYSGDANNAPAGPTACLDPAEDVIITQATPTISTLASAGGPVGTSVNDVATVSGGASPTGTVTFQLFSDAACTVQVFSSTNPVVTGTATSGNFTPTSVGTYRWVATYSGDANHAPAGPTACLDPAEDVEITQATPTISTLASAGGPVGTSINDVATVTGGASPTGTVTFSLFSDAACTVQVFTSTNPVVAGTATSGNFVPAAPGTYRWVATYSGDANHAAAGPTACLDPAEDVIITQATPTISTQASAGGPVGTSVNDVATVTGGASPTGTVTFSLFSDAACTAQVFTSTNPLVAGTATSSSFTPTSVGTYHWVATYSGDANNAA
ncbi:MAG: hypothetical protein LC708_02650, partial [Actinobacteria bacterium]|nr:hypothetical protein [Actinomycetota bacterium]